MELNNKQKEAVFAPLDVSVLVKAAAGTGKTTVLVERIAYLLESNIDKDQILAITYTKNAAENIKDRVFERLGIQLGHNVGTIHSVLGKGILPKLDYKREYLEIIEGEDEDRLFNRFDIKNKDRSDIKKYRSRANLNDIPISLKLEYKLERYKSGLKSKGKLDFDDILEKTGELLNSDIDFLKEIRKKYKVILIDEAQDLTKIQYAIFTEILKGGDANIFLVGDPNQCIFEFSGAKKYLFEDIEEFFLEKKDIKPLNVTLNVNYRSDISIVDFSNESRVFRNMDLAISHSKEHGKVIKLEKIDDILEILKKQQNLNEGAILCRSLKSSESHKLISSLIKNSIPLRLTQFSIGEKEKKQVKLIVGLLQIIYFDCARPLLNILYFLRFKQGKKTKDEFGTKFRSIDKKRTFIQYLLESDEGKEQINTYEEDIELFDNFLIDIKEARKHKDLSISDLYNEYIVPIFCRYSKEKYKNGDLLLDGMISIQKQENISNEELVANIQFFMNPGNSETEKLVSCGNNHLIISTVHKAKGLEGNNVIVIEKDLNEKDEDKNLPYVAYTRARHKLYLI